MNVSLGGATVSPPRLGMREQARKELTPDVWDNGTAVRVRCQRHFGALTAVVVENARREWLSVGRSVGIE